MRKPVVGIVANAALIAGQYRAQSCGNMNIEAIARVADAVPVVFPAMPHCVTVEELMAVCDGFLLTGGRSNVHPEEYGHEPTAAHGDFDRGRDRLVLPLIRACVLVGQPVLGLCRGFQEFNVAMGGTLHPEIRDLPGRMNHRMPPDGTIEEKFAHRHMVSLSPTGPFARMFGSDEVLVNSLHGQGIDEPGPRVVVEGRAPDGTAEAIVVKDAPGFAMAVQWHPEYEAARDPVSRPLFEAFGRALIAWKRGALSLAG